MKPYFWLATAAILCLGFVQAQEVKELPRHPGDVLKFEVKFDGPDAPKVKSISLLLRLKTEVPTSQSGFSNSMQTGYFEATSPDTFHPELKIRQDLPTGDYSLEIIAVERSGPATYIPGKQSQFLAAAERSGLATYAAGKQFPFHDLHIENSRTTAAPKIDVKELR